MGSQPQRGDRVAGYRIEERIGAGGSSEVYRARHERSGRVVALKLLRDGRRLAQRLQVACLRHPHIAQVLDEGMSHRGPYIAMELLRGISLRAALERAVRTDVTTALAVLGPVLGALDEAHRHGVTHGDLKPENVFLEVRDAGHAEVKLLDFGCPLSLEAGAVVGSASYLSPEQAAGEALDARSDVFGAGVLLFELVSGRPPFEANGAVATAYRVVHQPAPRLAHSALQRVLDVALAKAPSARFASAAAFAAALAPLAPGTGVSAEALSALARP